MTPRSDLGLVILRPGSYWNGFPMEPITTALVAALGKLAEPAVRDAYDGFKALLRRKFGAQHPVLEAVDNLEQKPESAGRRETLHEEVSGATAVADAELVAAAQHLLERVQQVGGGTTQVRQTVKGDRNIFTGTGDIHLGGKPP